jgi:hypothetical protein
MIKATPDDWITWNFTLSENDETVAQIIPAWFSESADIYVDGETYKASRESWMNGDFLFELNGTILLNAAKPSALSRSFTIVYDGRQYILEAESAFSRRFILMDPVNEIGSIDPESILTSDAAIYLPDEFPAHVKAFMFWLVMILWKRQADSAAHNPAM